MNRSLSDKLHETLRQKIIDGEYLPSQRLVEAQLAETFDVSRHNVRLALDRLQSDGLVTIEPHRGATVALLTLEQALDILVAREALEVEAARLAAARANAEHLDELAKHVKTMESALSRNDFDTYSKMNKSFHATISVASENQTIPWLMEMLRPRLARLQLRTILVPGRSVESLAEHTNLYLAIKSGDASAAEAAARAHLASIKVNIEKAWSLVKL